MPETPPPPTAPPNNPPPVAPPAPKEDPNAGAVLPEPPKDDGVDPNPPVVDPKVLPPPKAGYEEKYNKKLADKSILIRIYYFKSCRWKHFVLKTQPEKNKYPSHKIIVSRANLTLTKPAVQYYNFTVSLFPCVDMAEESTALLKDPSKKTLYFLTDRKSKSVV